MNLKEIDNWGRILPIVAPEVPDAADRAISAGAIQPLEYMGAGMFKIVFCDARDHAWSVGREKLSETPERLLFIREELEDEYVFFRTAAQSAVSEHIPKVYSFHPQEIVVERECIRGTPGGWGDNRELAKLHAEIEKAMIPMGWTSPEFKENSYVYQNGIPILVDASMVMRVGENLARWTDEVLRGERETHDRWHDMAFHVLAEMRHMTIPRDIAVELLERLSERDPEIRRSFSW